ncbi:hypothetical protein F5880DRAFT_1527053 [Lentinula raphanica]|nr:hypothetical protein F5880DRAFT_1527053 [Lentinula raphanica]
MRIINTVLPLVTLAVHVAGLHIPGDGGSYSKRSDLGSAKAVERRGPHTIASRSGPPETTPSSFAPSTDKVERRSPTPNPKGGDGDGDGGGGGSHSRSSTVASAEAAAAHDAAAAHIDAITAHNDCVRTRMHVSTCTSAILPQTQFYPDFYYYSCTCSMNPCADSFSLVPWGLPESSAGGR